MKKIKITIQPLSYLLNSAGKGRGLRDIDACFNKDGFPTIQRKTFKGLFRESLQEVLEIEGKPEKEVNQIVSDFFGEEGDDNQGRLYFETDFQLVDWNTISEQLANNPIPIADAKKYFTHEISQTKIAEDGVAEDHSLRTIAVLRPEVCFESYLKINNLTEKEETLLQKACWNLRTLGVQRNRGLGKVNVQISYEDITTDLSDNDKKSPELEFNNGTGLALNITTLSAILLTRLDSNLNTVYTENYISGNKIRGVLAALYIQEQKKKDASYHPDKNEDFYEIFLSGKVKFGFGYFNNAMTLPRNWQSTKAEPEKLLNLFKDTNTDSEPSEEQEKTITAYRTALVKEEASSFKKVSPSKTLHFHTSRPNRTAGRSLEDEGTIFYYETIDAGQEFTAKIYAESYELLQKLVAITNTTFDANIGKSKSTLGKVAVKIDTEKTPEKITGTVFQIIIKSPLVLLNQYGFPQISEALFNNELKKIHTDFKLDTTQMAFANCEIDQYISLWKAKTGTKIALAMGSTCIIESNTPLELDSQYFLGAYTEQGYGEVILKPYDKAFDASKFIKNENESPKFKEDTEFENKTLEEIRKQIAQKNRQIDIKIKALECADNFNHEVSNSFITRLITLFDAYNSKEEIDKEINKHKKKRFGLTLEKVGFVIKTKERITFYFGYKNNYSSFEDSKVFWIEFLKTIRLTNKAKNE